MNLQPHNGYYLLPFLTPYNSKLGTNKSLMWKYSILYLTFKYRLQTLSGGLQSSISHKMKIQVVLTIPNEITLSIFSLAFWLVRLKEGDHIHNVSSLGEIKLPSQLIDFSLEQVPKWHYPNISDRLVRLVQ